MMPEGALASHQGSTTIDLFTLTPCPTVRDAPHYRMFALGDESTRVLEPKPLCVVLDTNIWVRDFCLRTPAGAALIHTLRIGEGLIGLPEVTEMELVPVLIERGEKATREMEQRLDVLQRIWGYRPEFTVPDREHLEEAIRSWLDELDSLILRVPLDLDTTRLAIELAVNHRAPNKGNKEELRDSMIFLTAVSLTEDYRVVFVTDDGDYFEGDSLHPDLVDLLQSRGATLEVTRSLRGCLDLIGRGTNLDRVEIAEEIAEAIDRVLEDIVSENGFQIDRLDTDSVQLETFATEDPYLLTVTFEITFLLDSEDLSPLEAEMVGLDELMPYLREHATLTVNGSASMSDGAVHSFSLDSLVFFWDDGAGGPNGFTMHYERAVNDARRRRRPLEIRYKLL
jgi:hypothetical protein